MLEAGVVDVNCRGLGEWVNPALNAVIKNGIRPPKQLTTKMYDGRRRGKVIFCLPFFVTQISDLPEREVYLYPLGVPLF